MVKNSKVINSLNPPFQIFTLNFALFAHKKWYSCSLQYSRNISRNSVASETGNITYSCSSIDRTKGVMPTSFIGTLKRLKAFRFPHSRIRDIDPLVARPSYISTSIRSVFQPDTAAFMPKRSVFQPDTAAFMPKRSVVQPDTAAFMPKRS
jgi:hypothetical protein